MSDADPQGTTEPRRLARRVLLIGWDAADWRMMDPLLEQGLMPNLQRLINEGVMGNVASLTPMVSPILWTSIATGKYADKHGILGFAEPDGTTGAIRPVTSTSRTCRALWNILNDHGLRAGVVNWFASHPAEAIDGFVVTDRYAHAAGPPDDDWPMVPAAVHPEDASEALASCRIHPARTTPMQVHPFVPTWHELDPVNDENLRTLRMLLAHCSTVHAATTQLMQSQDWDFLGVYYDAIDRMGHAFMHFHPPKRPDVSDDEFRHFQHVMNGCYRFHDMMLGRLLELAGDDVTTIIVSDHGFHSDELRPAGSSRIRDGQPVAWHRTYGALVVHGPHIKRDQRVYGASLLDITPTILTMFGLPVGEDMDGQPLIQIFEEPPPVTRVDTHERNEDEVTAVVEHDPWVAAQMLEQLKALGYLETDDTEEIVQDRLRNLGQVYLSTGRAGLALEQFEQALANDPTDQAAMVGKASSLLAMGRLDDGEAVVRQLIADDPDRPRAHMYLGMIHFRRGQDEEALESLLKAEAGDETIPGLLVQIGQVHMRLSRLDDAERMFTRALERDPDSADAHDGLGVIYRHRKEPNRAVHAHMEAIGRMHHRPQSHVNLGLALAQVGRIRWAIRAFETALEMAPEHPVAHQALAQLYASHDRDPDRAAEHRDRADQVLSKMRERQKRGTAGSRETGE